MDKNMEYIASTQTLVGTKKKQLIYSETGEKRVVDQITKIVYLYVRTWRYVIQR